MASWERLARLYKWQLWLERPALRMAIEMAEIGAEDRLLDLGTGTAALLRQLADRGAGPREAIGVDTSPEMLARAPALPSGWQLLRANAAQLPFTERSFDVVSGAYLLHLLDQPTRRTVLAEARRVLRPGGRLLVVTVAAPRSVALARLLAPVFCAAQRSSGVLAGMRALDPRADLESSGFSVRRVRRITRGYPSMITSATIEPADESLSTPGGSKQL